MVDGERYVGGIVGYEERITVENCANTAGINGTGCVGGVSGYKIYGRTDACANTGAITGGDNIGGVIGNVTDSNQQKSPMAEVTNCYNTGTVEGKDFYGGIVGGLIEATVKKCYNTGEITEAGDGTSSAHCGGIFGLSNTYSGSNVNYGRTENCISLGTMITGKGAQGRVAGTRYSPFLTLKNNYARTDQKIGPDGQEAAPTVNIGADLVNGEDLFTDGSISLPEVFSPGNGWDTNIWDIPDGSLIAGEELPSLRGITIGLPVPTLPYAVNGDALLSSLNYCVNGGVAIPVPGFKPGKLVYEVELSAIRLLTHPSPLTGRLAISGRRSRKIKG